MLGGMLPLLFTSCLRDRSIGLSFPRDKKHILQCLRQKQKGSGGHQIRRLPIRRRTKAEQAKNNEQPNFSLEFSRPRESSPLVADSIQLLT
jgi:hypothetical protein